MKKKYVVKDEDREIEVIEEELNDDETPVETPVAETTALTNEEIVALKGLAGVADKLMALLVVEEKEHEATEDCGMTDAEGEEEDEGEDEDEEKVVDTMKKDSLASIGAIEKKKVRAEDSFVEDEVSAAWAKRYGGNV